VTLQGGVGFRAIAGLIRSRVEYRRMDALDVNELGERFDVVLCFGILHRVTDPIALLQALADVLAPGGELVLETYGSRLGAGAPAIEVHEPGDVYARDNFVYWGSPRRVCGALGGSSASTKSKSSTSWRSTATRGSSRCYERPSDGAPAIPPCHRRSGHQRRRRRARRCVRGPDAGVAPRRWAGGQRSRGSHHPSTTPAGDRAR
jgi:SAM-dependent methyltransferase